MIHCVITIQKELKYKKIVKEFNTFIKKIEVKYMLKNVNSVFIYTQVVPNP